MKGAARRSLAEPFPGSDPLDASDQALECCRNISAVADLLSFSDPSHLNPNAVPAVGELLQAETERLRVALKKALAGRSRR